MNGNFVPKPQKFSHSKVLLYTVQLLYTHYSYSEYHICYNILYCYHGAGYIGIVRDATETTARIKLHTTCTIISVDCSRITEVTA